MNYQETREAPFMAKLLSDFGVPTEALILERESRNTYENATLSAPILQNKGANRIILVTSAWHMRRSAAIFKKAKYDFVIYSVDSLQQPFSFPRDLIPDAQALDNLTRLLREWIGFVSYRALNRL
ncbi:hypothetical protein MASR2M78_11600 [Treponema sp.]